MNPREHQDQQQDQNDGGNISGKYFCFSPFA